MKIFKKIHEFIQFGFWDWIDDRESWGNMLSDIIALVIVVGGGILFVATIYAYVNGII